MSDTTRCSKRPRSWVAASAAANKANRAGDADRGHVPFAASDRRLNEWERQRNQASSATPGTRLS